MIKKLVIGVYLILVTWTSMAQQDPMYTQYNKNPLSINPAIAGLRNIDNLTLLVRSQWVGMDGAPKTSTINYQTRTNDKMGLGASLIYDKIGPVIQTGFYGDYAYHLKLDSDKDRNLSLGLMAGFNHYSFDLVSLHYNDRDDDIPTDGRYSRLLPNFGVGAFYYSPDFYFGVSIPKLLRNSLSEADNTLTIDSKEERHFFTMLGAFWEINQDFNLRPSVMGRIVNGAPLSLDINATLIYKERIYLGGLYRVGVSFGGIVGWQLNDKLYLSYSYDFYNRNLGSLSFGTHEIVLSYEFSKKKQRVISPRYF